MMELRDTVELMVSDDYRERFRAEYWQVYIRDDRLRKLLVDWDEGKLDFEPSCPRELLDQQCQAMAYYLRALEKRAVIEHIDLYQDVKRCARKKSWINEERKTCRIEQIEFDDGTLQYRLELSCGDTVYYDEMRGPNFCPECGALVVRGSR